VKGVGKKKTFAFERSSQKYFSQKGAFLTVGLEENKKRLEKKENSFLLLSYKAFFHQILESKQSQGSIGIDHFCLQNYKV